MSPYRTRNNCSGEALLRSACMIAWGMALAFSPPSRAELSVSNSGSPTYVHTIGVPPGVAGLSPRVALSYSAGTVNGPAGYGWGIQGVSAVTRCPADHAIDGVRTGVAFSIDDKLCLDGQRLVPIDGNGNAIVGRSTADAAGQATYREYRTETDSYARVRAYGYASDDTTGASGPAFFKVWTKTGQTVEYGASPASDVNTNALIKVQGGTAAMVWAVARISDVVGNRIDYKYEQREVPWGSGPTTAGSTPGREWNLVEVQYSGNKLVFQYVDRTAAGDASEAYQQGAKNASVRLLKSIVTFTNSPNTGTLGAGPNAVAVKTTKLVYDNGPVTRRSRLRSIQECAGGASSTRCTPSTKFDYSSGGSEAYVAHPAFNQASVQLSSAADAAGVITADFNGDGKADLIRWADDPAQNKLLRSNGDGTFTELTAFNIKGHNLFKSDRCFVTMTSDVNGDGVIDLIRYSGPVAVNGAACANPGPVLVFLSNGDGTFSAPTYVGPTLRRDTGATFFLLDFTGDGKVDIVTSLAGSWVSACPPDRVCTPRPPVYRCTDASGVCTKVFRGNGDGTFTELTTNAGAAAVYSSPLNSDDVNNSRRVGDLDGDGLQDLGSLYDGDSRVLMSPGLLSKGDGNFQIVSTGATSCAYPIDFNGDGRSDCLEPHTSGMNYLSLGNGGAVAGFDLTGTGKELAGIGIGFVVADVNADARQDIIRWKDDPAQNVIYLSNGDGTFSASSSFNLAGVQLKKADRSAHIVVADFTGKGNVEILRLQTVGGVSTNQLYVKQDPTPPDQLTSVTTSSGAATSFVYVPLGNPVPASGSPSANLGPRYRSDRDLGLSTMWPQIDVTFPVHVVATVVADSGVGNMKLNTEYSYYGLKADIQGRGFQGFREVRRQSPGSDGSPLTHVLQFLQKHPYIGSASEVAMHNAPLNAVSPANSLTKVVNVYCDHAAGPAAQAAALAAKVSCASTARPTRPYVLLSTRTGRDLQGAALPTITTQTSVNATGDPTTVTVNTSGLAVGMNQAFVQTTTNAYFPDETGCADALNCTWRLGLLQQSTVNSTVPNALPSVATSAGSAPLATATVGQAGGLPPGLLASILQLLLDD